MSELPLASRQYVTNADCLWFQAGVGGNLHTSVQRPDIESAGLLFAQSYGASELPGAWARLTETSGLLLASWSKVSAEEWFPRWHATSQVLFELAKHLPSATIAMIEMVIDGDIHRAVKAELEEDS